MSVENHHKTSSYLADQQKNHHSSTGQLGKQMLAGRSHEAIAQLSNRQAVGSVQSMGDEQHSGAYRSTRLLQYNKPKMSNFDQKH